MPAEKGVAVAPEGDPYNALGQQRFLAIKLEDVFEGSDVQPVLVDEHELEAGEVAQMGEGLEVILREVKFDEVDAQAEGVYHQRIGRVQDQ